MPVASRPVAGNLLDALGAVLGTSRGSQRIFGFTLTYVRVDGLSVTAA